MSRYCLPNFVQAGSHSDDSDGQGRDQSDDDAEEQWLDAAFAPQAPPLPLPSMDEVSVGSINLDSLSRKTHCSEFYSNASGQVQDDYFVTSARSFDSQKDYYYVQDFPKIMWSRPTSFMSVTSGQPFLKPPGSRDTPLIGTRLLFSEPATTTAYISQYTNSASTTLSGNIGFEGLSLNISASVSVTVGTATTVNVPPVTIRNNSLLSTGTVLWNLLPANPLPHVLYSTAESWVWFIDRNVYGDAPNDVAEVFSDFQAGTDSTTAKGRCGFRPPFSTFTVTAPEVTNAVPANVNSGGGVFTIRGARMYPGIVTDVLLGGDALPAANFVRVSDTEIRVVVPNNQKKGMNAIQVNTSFNGTVLPSNTDVRVNVK